MPKNKTNITQLIQDLKNQTEKYGHFEHELDPGGKTDKSRDSHYYKIDASTVGNLLGALEELRGLVGKG